MLSLKVGILHKYQLMFCMRELVKELVVANIVTTTQHGAVKGKCRHNKLNTITLIPVFQLLKIIAYEQ